MANSKHFVSSSCDTTSAVLRTIGILRILRITTSLSWVLYSSNATAVFFGVLSFLLLQGKLDSLNELCLENTHWEYQISSVRHKIFSGVLFVTTCQNFLAVSVFFAFLHTITSGRFAVVDEIKIVDIIEL